MNTIRICAESWGLNIFLIKRTIFRLYQRWFMRSRSRNCSAQINEYLFNIRKLCYMKAFYFKKVMIIDDDYLSRLIVEKMIKKFDFADEVVECATAIEGLNYLNTNPL